MGKTYRKVISICFLLALIPFINLFSQNIIRAKIAVMHKAGNSYEPLRSNDRVRVGEMLRIFIEPFNNCYVYVVSTDNSGSSILYNNKVKAEKDTLILPSRNEFYTYDENSTNSKLTIFCSLKKMQDVETLFSNSRHVKETAWNKVESSLINKYEKKFGGKSEKPFSIAGNVSAANEKFLEKQRTLSGKEVIIRKYEIEIQK